MFSLLSFLWFIRTTKAILFWFYLWQLKEYHLGRFLDHFQTEKGKQLFLNKILGFKIALILIFFVLPVFLFFVLFFLYLFEAAKAILDFFRKRIKRPVLTKKTALLILSGILVEILFLFAFFQHTQNILLFVFGLLVFDVLTPLIASIIVLLLQPLAALKRNKIIKKAKVKREKFKDLLIIGITGSYGKTSTKEFLATILSEKYNVLKTKEHQNSEVGISQCILNDLKEEQEIFICEMGAYNRGGIKLLCDIAKPKIGVLTGINQQHMATFGSLENIIKTKYELIESLPEDGVAFFNAKNKYCLDLYQKTKIKKQLYGREASFPGEENILGAIVVARELDMSDEEIKRAVEKIENKFPGIQLKKVCLSTGRGINGLKIIDATYSANPDGVIAHLEYLKTFPGKKVIVMPCLIELGKASKEVHKRIGQKIAEVCDLAIITTKERFKEIKEGAGDKALFLENPENIYKKIRNFCLSSETLAKEEKNKCVVLLESRVPKQLIKQLIV